MGDGIWKIHKEKKKTPTRNITIIENKQMLEMFTGYRAARNFPFRGYYIQNNDT